MQLHQLLRFIQNNTAIIIFDIQGIEICKVEDKSKINVDLYEYGVYSIKIHTAIWDKKPYIGIVLLK